MSAQGTWDPEFISGFKLYIATLIQASTGAPAATIIQNNVGAIVWARTGAGVYTATLSGAFTVAKTYAVAASPLSIILAVRTSANVMTFTNTTDGSTPADDFTATVHIFVKA